MKFLNLFAFLAATQAVAMQSHSYATKGITPTEQQRVDQAYKALSEGAEKIRKNMSADMDLEWWLKWSFPTNDSLRDICKKDGGEYTLWDDCTSVRKKRQELIESLKNEYKSKQTEEEKRIKEAEKEQEKRKKEEENNARKEEQEKIDAQKTLERAVERLKNKYTSLMEIYTENAFNLNDLIEGLSQVKESLQKYYDEKGKEIEELKCSYREKKKFQETYDELEEKIDSEIRKTQKEPVRRETITFESTNRSSDERKKSPTPYTRHEKPRLWTKEETRRNIERAYGKGSVNQGNYNKMKEKFYFDVFKPLQRIP